VKIVEPGIRLRKGIGHIERVEAGQRLAALQGTNVGPSSRSVSDRSA
jgi:hypothetical protein